MVRSGGLVQLREKVKIFKIRGCAAYFLILSDFAYSGEDGVWLFWRGEINNLWSCESNAMIYVSKERF